MGLPGKSALVSRSLSTESMVPTTALGTLGFPKPVKFIHSPSKDLLRACCLPGMVPGFGRVYKNE